MAGLINSGMTEQQGQSSGGQRIYTKLVLMTLQYLMQRDVFMQLVAQAQQGDAGQAIGGGVVRALLGQRQAAQQAGMQIDTGMLSAASVEIAQRLAEAFALLGVVQDAESTARDAIEYGKTLTQGGGGQAAPADQEPAEPAPVGAPDEMEPGMSANEVMQ